MLTTADTTPGSGILEPKLEKLVVNNHDSLYGSASSKQGITVVREDSES